MQNFGKSIKGKQASFRDALIDKSRVGGECYCEALNHLDREGCEVSSRDRKKGLV